MSRVRKRTDPASAAAIERMRIFGELLRSEGASIWKQMNKEWQAEYGKSARFPTGDEIETVVREAANEIGFQPLEDHVASGNWTFAELEHVVSIYLRARRSDIDKAAKQAAAANTNVQQKQDAFARARKVRAAWRRAVAKGIEHTVDIVAYVCEQVPCSEPTAYKYRPGKSTKNR